MTNGLQRRAFTAVAFVFLSITAHAAIERYSAQLSGSAVVPPNQSAGTGTFAATFDTETMVLSFTLRFQALSGPATATHIHGPADKGASAGIVVPFGANNPVSPVTGNATLTSEQARSLHDNLLYVDVHTSIHPGGEIRGQIVGKAKANSRP
jgi:hypothetical protein